MANLTISVDDETLKQARIRALRENTTVNAVLGKYLAEYAQHDKIKQRRQEALKSLLLLAEQCQCERAGSTWSRDDLYER